VVEGGGAGALGATGCAGCCVVSGGGAYAAAQPRKTHRLTIEVKRHGVWALVFFQVSRCSHEWLCDDIRMLLFMTLRAFALRRGCTGTDTSVR